MIQSFKNTLKKLAIASILLPLADMASATVVQFQTNLGTFEINLYDETAPITVNNFLSYVSDMSYNDTVIHRSVPDFVIQGGGYLLDEDTQLEDIQSKGAIQNEPVHTSLRGTIAMAKLGGNPNSATSEWFINLKNNSTTLDNQNGGFTVFGKVTGDGMSVVDAIANLPRPLLNTNTAFPTIPLQDVTPQTEALARDNFIVIESITVLDASIDTAAALDKPLNTLVGTNTVSGGGSGSDSGGGSFSYWYLILLGLVACSRYFFVSVSTKQD